jgi:DNA-binding NtrC family response regulator
MGVLYCVSREKEELGLLQKDRLFLEACSLYVSMSLENLNYRIREKEATREEERTRQESRFLPVIGRLRAEKENLALKQKDRDAPLFGMDGAADPGLAEFIKKASKTELPLLLTGETGSGKSVLAREIHGQSRSKRPFVTVDCTTIPSELLESELFGHEKGAFTGAHAKKAGKVQSARDGSLFIDEIGDLPLKLQGKLLRLIQSGEYEPVGSTQTQKTPARLMFATNKDLRAEIKAGRFREDLYFRLNVLQYAIPPLRDKKERILPLAGHFLAVNREKINARVKGFARRAEAALLAHAWPGNVRELENAIMRALVNAEGDRIDIGDLELMAHSTHTGAPPAPEPGGDDGLDLKKAREALDRAYIQKALTLTGRNVSKAAGRLNISRNALMELIKKYGL